MSYTILDRPIRYNHDGTKLVPQGVVIHSTATPEATDEDEIAYFDACNRDASAHYFIDYDSISRAIQEREVAWHAGPTANSRFIGIELCEFRDQAKFLEVWKRGVWLTADICKRYGFGVDKVFSHRETSRMYRETNHTDPDGYFASHGKTWAQFKADVQAVLQGAVPSPSPAPVPVPNPTGAETYRVVAGDTLWGIAQKCKVTVEQLKAWNGLTSDLITPGQVLKVQAPTEPQPQKFYRVFVGGKQVGAFTVKENAVAEGWKQYNAGKKDCYMTTPEDWKYTFDLHPDENPNRTTPTPTPGTPDAEGTTILGTIVASVEQMASFVQKVNSRFDPAIAEAFLALGAKYGIRGDVAFCQSIHETNYFRFTGDVKADQNNFCGLGATGNGNPGLRFATVEEGVRAQMQHLYGYATDRPFPQDEPLVDPRYPYIQKGCAPHWEDLAGKWAVPGYDRIKYATLETAMAAGDTYGQLILKLHKQLLDIVVPPNETPPAEQDTPKDTQEENPEEWLKQAMDLLAKYHAHISNNK